MRSFIFAAFQAASLVAATAIPGLQNHDAGKATTTREAHASTTSTMAQCLASAGVPYDTVSSSEWNQEILPFNERWNGSYIPVAAALPKTNAHVSSAILCAAKHNTKVAARSGGHSYAAYGLGGQNGSLMIDLYQFNEVTLDNKTGIATVGGGVRLGNMASELFTLGERGMPHGTCSGVGIGGHASYGGFGLDSRMWGLAVDMIQSMTAVLANGSIVTVSEEEHPDLYWGLRGAGPNFAVITEFKMKTFPAPSENIFWSYAYTFTTVSKSAKAFMVAQSWGEEKAPKELGYGIVLGPNGAFTIRGVYYGAQSTFESLIQPLLDEMKAVYGKDATATVLNQGWLDSLTELAGSELKIAGRNFGEHDTFYAKSIVTDDDLPLSLSAVTSFFTYVYAHGNDATNAGDWYIIVNLYGGPGSVINAQPLPTAANSTSSYAHRRAGYVWQFYSSTDGAKFRQSIQDFVTGMVNAFGAEAANLGYYVPYIDPALNRTTALTKYFGDSKPRLQSLKTQYDSGSLFWNPQSFLG